MKKEELKGMATEQLHEIITLVQEEIASRNGAKLEVHLHSNAYKGSGKCWIARVDQHKKILGFVDAHTTIPDGYEKGKIFFLVDDDYLLCEKGSKSRDTRRYITVKDGKEIS